jgi:IS30 family transposase
MHTNPTNYKQLQPDDRMAIARLWKLNFSIRRIVGVLECLLTRKRGDLRRNSDEGA